MQCILVYLLRIKFVAFVHYIKADSVYYPSINIIYFFTLLKCSMFTSMYPKYLGKLIFNV
jgi:hypothetical protein